MHPVEYWLRTFRMDLTARRPPEVGTFPQTPPIVHNPSAGLTLRPRELRPLVRHARPDASRPRDRPVLAGRCSARKPLTIPTAFRGLEKSFRECSRSAR